MGKPATLTYRRAGTPAPAPYVPFARRAYGKLLLLLFGVLLLSLAFSPYKQFYLAWIGLVPWLVVLKNCRTQWRAFGWSWFAGTLFFSANMWWLAYVTGPGLIALMLILGVYWALAGVIIRGMLLPPDEGRGGQVVEWRGQGKPAVASTPSLRHSATRPLLTVLGIAAVWVALEWLRGTWPFNGLPWLYLGHTQTPVLHLCQVADFAGELGVSFWVALVNAWVALFVLNRFSVRRLVPAGAMVAAVVAGVVGYGFFRFAQEAKFTTPGPTVMVVQPNIPQSNTGEKGASMSEIIDWHKKATARALTNTPGVDLVIWSETMMPPLNREARLYLGREDGGLIWEAHDLISAMAQHFHTNFLVGGMYWADLRLSGKGYPQPADSRNVAYFYERTGAPSDVRYEKIHLVPFGEYIPFKEAWPALYRMLISLGPPDMENYQLHAGSEQNLSVFPMAGPHDPAGVPARTWRFVVPICFEDIDGSLVAQMMRPAPGPPGSSAASGKRADFIVNITNDGWFKANEMPQHLQAAQFRSIENRAPTARSVNTGISGFIDSMGRPYNLVPAGTEGTSVATLRLDSRVTVFTHWGRAFGDTCAAAAGLMVVGGIVRWFLNRRRARAGR